MKGYSYEGSLLRAEGEGQKLNKHFILDKYLSADVNKLHKSVQTVQQYRDLAEKSFPSFSFVSTHATSCLPLVIMQCQCRKLVPARRQPQLSRPPPLSVVQNGVKGARLASFHSSIVKYK